MSNFSLNSSFDMNRELLLEKRRAQEAERRFFGNSVLAELDGDKVQISSVAPKQKASSQNVVTQPQNANNNVVETAKVEADDGKISFKEKMKNFGKGLVAPIKTMFSSPKNIAFTAVTALACAAIIGVTGGAAAPVFVAAGLIGGGVQIIKGIQKQSKATTDAQAKEAWQDMGSGTFTVGVSALSAKSALKGSGTDVKGMSTIKAAGKCITDVPKNISTGIKTAKTNISNFAMGMKTTNPKTKAPKGSTKGLPAPDVDGGVPKSTTTEPPKGKTATIEKPVVDVPESVNTNPSGTGVVEATVEPSKTIVRNANEQQLLPAPKEKLLLSAPEERLLIEAPKVIDTPEPAIAPSSTAEATSSAANSGVKPKATTSKKAPKHSKKNDYFKPSFCDRVKAFFRVFGLFKDETITK